MLRQKLITVCSDGILPQEVVLKKEMKEAAKKEKLKE
jgi:hypothetical protein